MLSYLIEYRSVLLNEYFQLNASELLRACNKQTKLIWLCSPNTPTGNILNVEEVEKVLSTIMLGNSETRSRKVCEREKSA